ncbi:uncharacterized protein LOC129250792, partial [Anastrepha obliqua]|uniref:uncharacterized protein LOC129250792 n=1 Tax=Anastrepha obliqua TaxID=95512 RepID=UPI002408FE7D
RVGNENFPNRLDDDDFPSTSRVALQNLEYDIDSGDDSVFLRSDSTFKNRIDLSYHSLEFKQAESLLESFNFGMVSQFPLEPMHLVDLGVTKKLLQLLIKKGNVTKMNEKLLLLNRFVPSEFSRLSRDLDQISNWKSTEFRQFLLYTGIFVLKDCINEDLYYHFLLLHAGIRFLSCEKSFNVESNVANELLKEFVDLFGNIYGDHLISYNVHGLLHLSDCVREFGPLDNFSAYKFENYMQHLKKIINKPNKILQQMFFRISERLKISDSSKLSKNDLFIIDFNKDKDSYFQCNKGPIKIVGLDKETNSFKALLISNLENYFIEPVESMSGLGSAVQRKRFAVSQPYERRTAIPDSPSATVSNHATAVPSC